MQLYIEYHSDQFIIRYNQTMKDQTRPKYIFFYAGSELVGVKDKE